MAKRNQFDRPPSDAMLAESPSLGIQPIFTADEISERMADMAESIAHWFEEDLVAQVVMNGAFMFASDLTRALANHDIVIEMDFLTVEKDRRKGTRSLGFASNRPVLNRDVLIIDDIFETGRTLKMAHDHFTKLGASSITSVALLDKSKGRDVAMRPDYIGFDCPDYFVIGYGMDIGYRYRELPFIGRIGQA